MERWKKAERVILACREREISLSVFITFSTITLPMKWLHTELCRVTRIYIKPSRSGKENSKPKKTKPRTCCCNSAIFLSKYIVKDGETSEIGTYGAEDGIVVFLPLLFYLCCSCKFFCVGKIKLLVVSFCCCVGSVSLTCNWKIDLISSSKWTVFQANNKKEKNK